MNKSPTENTEELLTKISDVLWVFGRRGFTDKETVADSARKIEHIFEEYTDQAVQAFGEKVLGEAVEVTPVMYNYPDGSRTVVGIANSAVPVSVITSLMKGSK